MPASLLPTSLPQLASLSAYGSSLGNPSGSGAIVAAVQWLESTLLGTIATTVAVIAVAGIGFMALSGRIDIRRALTVILGCFILFGASSIVAGLQSLAHNESTVAGPPTIIAADRPPLNTLPQRPAGYDPYAGAAVPTH